MNTLSEKTKRKYLIKIIENYLNTGIVLMKYFRAVGDTTKAKSVCTKSIKKSKQAIEYLNEIKHIEILEYLYSTFIGNNVIAYSMSGNIVLAKQLEYYDKDNNIQEFRDELERQRKEKEDKERTRQESMEVLKKAKEQGKKVEMVWDKDTKTAKPLIIEEKPNEQN